MNQKSTNKLGENSESSHASFDVDKNQVTGSEKHNIKQEMDAWARFFFQVYQKSKNDSTLSKFKV